MQSQDARDTEVAGGRHGRRPRDDATGSLRAYGRKLASWLAQLVISVAIGWLVTPCLRTPRPHQTQDPIDPRLRPC